LTGPLGGWQFFVHMFGEHAFGKSPRSLSSSKFGAFIRGRFFLCWIRADWVGARKNGIFVEIFLPVNFHDNSCWSWPNPTSAQ
jgi:hypothetical protein